MPGPDLQAAADARFTEARKLLLARPRLAAIDPDEVRVFLAGLSRERYASVLYDRPHPHPYIQPRGGVGRLEKQDELNQELDRAGADFLPLTIDSHTRHNDYEAAATFLAKSQEEDREYLNGYPLVNHGHLQSRGLYQEIDRPISLRHGTPDARELVEVALATGITDIEGGPLCYTLPYSRSYPLDRALLHWQYIDRLCAESSTHGRVINRESFGVLTATLVPPAVVVAVEVLELLMAAEHGVKSFALSYGQTGSIEQDCGLGMALRSVARTYLERQHFDDVACRLVYHQWMGAFPTDKYLADALIANSALIAKLVAADKIVVKTRDEAFGIPTALANAQAVRSVRYVFDTVPVLSTFTSEMAEQEHRLISGEAIHVLDAILDLPGRDLWERVFAAVRRGLIDIPFAPHQLNANRVLAVRGANAAIRIADPGLMPILPEHLDQERRLLAARVDSDLPLYRQMLEDIYVMVPTW